MDDPQRIVAGLDLGADDFIGKPVDARELIARVRVHLRYARREHDLERRALVDPLTGVLNRRGIFAVLRHEHERVRRSGAPLSVLLLDIDRFKALNDELGHQAGDTALRQLAAALLRSVRAADQVGRIGGDEFLIILPDADADAAFAMAARLRALRATAVASGETRDVQASVGAATLEAEETVDTLVARADRAMYKLKRTGEMPILPR
jgi:two-component system, cell cycle response regulator